MDTNTITEQLPTTIRAFLEAQEARDMDTNTHTEQLPTTPAFLGGRRPAMLKPRWPSSLGRP